MVKDQQQKVAISGIHTKMVVLKNHACAPFVHGVTKYEVKEKDEKKDEKKKGQYQGG